MIYDIDWRPATFRIVDNPNISWATMIYFWWEVDGGDWCVCVCEAGLQTFIRNLREPLNMREMFFFSSSLHTDSPQCNQCYFLLGPNLLGIGLSYFLKANNSKALLLFIKKRGGDPSCPSNGFALCLLWICKWSFKICTYPAMRWISLRYSLFRWHYYYDTFASSIRLDRTHLTPDWQ